MSEYKNTKLASVSGTICGIDAPLQLVLIRLNAGDFADQTWPSREKIFGHSCLATGKTDGNGSYKLEYSMPADVSEEDTGQGQVVLQAFSDNKLRWQSPEMPWDNNLDVGGFIEPQVPPRTYTVQGHITNCSEPADGYIVSAHAIISVGHPQPGNTCLLGVPNTRFIGSSPVDLQGHYTIAYTAPRAPTGACGFVASIFVEVSRASGPIDWQSESVKLRPSITFDHDLLVDCLPGTSLIQVVDINDRSVEGAEVVSVNGVLGVTNSAGYLAVPGLAEGDMIAARWLLLESETSRDHHDRGSNQNWNYRCYQTTVGLDFDSQGNNVSMGVNTVALANSVQKLRITPQNALVGFNLVVSVQWDATPAELLTYRDRFRETSELLYNATDGQFCIEQLSILNNAKEWDSADFRVYASIKQRTFVKPLFGVNGSSGRIRMNPIDTNFPGTILHELGHYLFPLRDEYEAGSNWDPNNESPRCTLASGPGGSVFSDGGSKHACVMNGHRGATPKKFCSAHSDNPHVDGTEQGGTDCWTDILQEYSAAGIGLANSTHWQPRGPVQHQAIVDRLPISGNPLGTVKSAPNAEIPGSFIPFDAWKPRMHISSTQVDNRCPGFIVRVIQNGLPIGNVPILLLTATGRTIFQGFTRTAGASNLQDGTLSVEGELVIRGAHVSDQVQAGLQNGINTKTIVDCGSVLEIDLSQWSFSSALSVNFNTTGALNISTVGASSPPLLRVGVDDVDLPAMINLEPSKDEFKGTVQFGPGDQELQIDALFTGADGQFFNARESISVIEVSPYLESSLRSVDGQLKLDIFQKTVPMVGRIGVRQIHQSGPELAGWQLTAGPFQLFATFGKELSKASRVQMRPGDADGDSVDESSFLLARLNTACKEWEAIKTVGFHGSPLVISAEIKQLGVYAIFSKTNDVRQVV